MKTDIIKYLLIYTLSFLLSIFSINIINKLVNNNKKKNRFYNINFYKNAPIDYLICLIYLLVSYLLIKLFELKRTGEQLLLVWITTIILSFGFFSYFKSRPQNSNFLLKRFNSSINYDPILIVIIFSFYIFFQKNNLVAQI